jgi:predicted amino acid-binding ACT domain protein
VELVDSSGNSLERFCSISNAAHALGMTANNIYQVITRQHDFATAALGHGRSIRKINTSGSHVPSSQKRRTISNSHESERLTKKYSQNQVVGIHESHRLRNAFPRGVYVHQTAKVRKLHSAMCSANIGHFTQRLITEKFTFTIMVDSQKTPHGKRWLKENLFEMGMSQAEYSGLEIVLNTTLNSAFMNCN